MPVIKAQEVGFCCGVKRAVSIAETFSKKNTLYTLGPLIHNPQVVKELEKKNILQIERLSEAPKNAQIISRTHGIPKQLYQEAKSLGLKIIDATCPNVLLAKKIAIKLHKEKYFLIIVGDNKHPEVKSILSYIDNNYRVISSEEEINNDILNNFKVGVIAQTTQLFDNFKTIVNKLLHCNEIRIYNTLCKEVIRRHRVSVELAKDVDILLIVGGYNSANTKNLVKLCKNYCKNVYHIEIFEDIQEHHIDIDKTKKIGITGGTSTPSWLIDDIINKLNKCYDLYEGVRKLGQYCSE